MPHHALLTKGLKGHKVSAQSKGPGSATDGFTSFSGVVSSELPDGWQLRRLGELVERPQYGLTASATGEPKGPRFLRITDIQESGVAWRTVPYCECNADSAERLRLRPGDVVVARIGATTGKAYLIRDEVDAVFASYLIRLRATDRLVPDFLAFFTNSAPYWRQIDSVKGGRLKQGINIPLLESLEIPLPPLAEQRAIAEVLRTVQRAKEATEKVIAATRQLKASLMKHLFTCGPVPFDQADRVPLKETEVGPIPQHWQVRPIGEFARLAQYGLSVRGSASGCYPMLRMNNLQDGQLVTENVQGGLQYVDVDDATLPKFRLAPSDLLFNCTNSMSATQARLKLLASRGVSQSTINARKLKAFEVPVPPLAEQQEISAQLAAVDAMLGAEERRREALDALFKSLLHHLMTGRLRLPEFARGRD